MKSDLHARLLHNVSTLLENPTFADVSVKVGQEPNTKNFLAHSAILSARSSYFAVALSGNWAKREGNIINFTKPNITPYVFQLILKYVYYGDVNIDNEQMLTIFELLVAADELCLDELVDYLQLDLLDKRTQALKENFVKLQKTVFLSESFKKLQDFCTELATNNPKAIFNSNDFTTLPIKALGAIIERDDLDMKESDIWDHVVKWGTAQINLSVDAIDSWSSDDFSSFYQQVKECLQFVRFFNMSAAEFYYKVKPFAEILPGTLYEDLLRHYLISGSHDDYVKPRAAKKSISRLITDQKVTQIETWINGENALTTQNTPSSYKFKLLLRGSRDGFTATNFHGLCDKKGPTVSIIKVKDSGQIIGGYTPISWHSQNSWESGVNSFIFSLDTKDPKKQILSRHNEGKGIYCGDIIGPSFGPDLTLYGDNFSTTNYKASSCKKTSYKYPIIEGANEKTVCFLVDDYEVFQVSKE